MRWLLEAANKKRVKPKRSKPNHDFSKGISKQDVKRLTLKASKFPDAVWVDKQFTCQVCNKAYSNYFDLNSEKYWNTMHGCCSQYCLDKVNYPESKQLIQE